MKKLTILMGILLAGSYALAQDTGSSTDPYGGSSSSGSSTSGKAPASDRSDSSSQYKQHAKVTADVVAADETSKTITVRPVAAGTSSSSSSSASSLESVTLPVEGKAVASLKSIKSGERVSLTCRNDSSSSGSAGSSTGSSASGSSSGMGSSSGSMGSTAGSQLSAANCNSVTEISKVKATTSGSSAD
jgi:hypothetical protein